MVRLMIIVFLLSVVGLGAAPASAEVEAEDFVVADAADLVDLCSVATGDELYFQAIHMCHGYASAVGHYALILSAESGGQIFCFPNPAPSRNEAIADWVTWMGSHQEYMGDPAPEALVRYLVEAFPCR